MADPLSDPESSTGTPRWVKVFGVIAIVVAVLFVVQLLIGGGRHGPTRHRVSDAGETQPGGVAEVGAPREVDHR